MIDTDKEERRREAGLFNKLGYIDFDVADNLLAEVERLRSVIEDIESMIPDNHEEVSPILSDILSECHRVLPMFNEVIE